MKFNKPNLTLKLAVKSIKSYESTTKNSRHYNNVYEGKAETYYEVMLKNTRQCTRCRKTHKKEKKAVVLIIENAKNAIVYTISKNVTLLK